LPELSKAEGIRQVKAKPDELLPSSFFFFYSLFAAIRRD
jgi:hypothetical protein